MRNRFWDKRIPTFLGILFLAISIGITTFLVKQGGLISTSAAPSYEPKDVRITNITDNSFTVSYFTKDPASGVINYGDTPNLGTSALDDKDQTLESVSNYRLHGVTVKNLTPTTKYYFSIISGKDTYTNNSSPFEIITGKTIEDTKEPISLTGKVVLPDQKPPNAAIVYLTANNAHVISSEVKRDGSFSIPLNTLRNSDLNSYYEIENDTVIKLLIYGDELSSNVLLSPAGGYSTPAITLSNDYDFIQTSQPQIINTQTNTTFPSFESKNAGDIKSPQILTPQNDQSFTDTKPQFKGTAVPGEEVQIIIHSDENINSSVTSDKNGNWTYTPTTPLSPGEHTITVVTRDASGILRTITQSFVVYASENQTSNSLSSSPTPTNTLIAKASYTPTPTPAITDINQSITPTPSIPPTGNPAVITAGIVGLLLSFIGGLLFLLTRGGVKL